MRKLICRDSFGNKIYPGDTVELFQGIETRTPWTSTVHWNMLDGAFVDSHPTHRKMNLSTHRVLREFLDKEDWKVQDTEGNWLTMKTYCKKIKTDDR